MNESHDKYWDGHGKRKIITIKFTKKNHPSKSHLHQSQPYSEKLHPHFQTLMLMIRQPCDPMIQMPPFDLGKQDN